MDGLWTRLKTGYFLCQKHESIHTKSNMQYQVGQPEFIKIKKEGSLSQKWKNSLKTLLFFSNFVQQIRTTCTILSLFDLIVMNVTVLFYLTAFLISYSHSFAKNTYYSLRSKLYVVI